MAHSGIFNERCTPSLETCEAVECTCRSARLIWFMRFRITLQTEGLVKNEVTFCDDLVTVGMGSPGHRRTLRSCLCQALGPRIRSSCERGSLRVEVALRPFELTVYRGERRALRSMGAWVADGTVHDHFIQLTEGRGGA